MTPKIIRGTKIGEGKRGRGRPAVFDRAIALQAAMKLFWERGYEGTSFDDMMAAHRAFSESTMAARIRKGVADGDVAEDVDCDMLAAYYSAVARGLAVQARDGA